MNKCNIFEVTPDEIEQVIKDWQNKGLALAMIDATDELASEKCFKIWYIFSALDGTFTIPFIRVKDGERFPSVAHLAPAMGWCERKIKEMFGIEIAGSADDRSLLLHENWPADVYPLRKNFDGTTRPDVAKGNYEFNQVDGEGVYEIPVGPIHAGIIEPGHFRFSMAGESIMQLEPHLGFVHKGHEKLFETLPLDQKVRLAEKISGDSSFTHSLAFCQAVEQLAGIEVPQRAEYLRTIFAELERLACHIGDIGFIMLDTGFNFGGASGQRLREAIMQINQRLSGSRFLRGINVIGGVTKDIAQPELLKKELQAWLKDAEEVLEVAENSLTFLNRAKTTGRLKLDVACRYSAVGYAARATGMAIDARKDHPYAAYSKLSAHKVTVQTDGDVFARFCVRAGEVKNSVAIICQALNSLPVSAIKSDKKIKLQPNQVAIGCVEGWRGEILHFAKTDPRGEISRVAVRDPSCINWQLIPHCIDGNIVLDFPLINKSFNLSYTGNDL